MPPTDDIATRFREFVSLDRERASEPLPAELTRWTLLKRLLGRELQGAHADDRASLRVPAQLRVSFASLGELGEALITRFAEAEGEVRKALDALYERALQAAAPRRR